MKNRLGPSVVLLVLLSATPGSAQTPSAPTNSTTAAPAPAAPSTPAPTTTVGAPAGGSAAPNQIPPSPGPTPPPDTSAQPAGSSVPNPYGPYGFPPPLGADGWIVKKEILYRGGPIPYGYKLETRYNLGLLIAGPTLFGLSYLVAVYFASSAEGINGYNLSTREVNYIPVTGPFAFAAYSNSDTTFLYVFDGLAQLTGVGLFLGGLLAPKDMLVPKGVNEAYRPSLRVGPGQVQLQMKF